MEEWHVWIIAALLLFLIEVFTTGFAHRFCGGASAAAEVYAQVCG